MYHATHVESDAELIKATCSRYLHLSANISPKQFVIANLFHPSMINVVLQPRMKGSRLISNWK